MLALYGLGRYPAIAEFTMLPKNNRNSFSGTPFCVNIKIITYSYKSILSCN